MKKTISAMIMLVTVLTVLLAFMPKANAATYLISEADLYSKGELVCFTYQGIKVGVEFVVYEKDGVEYPAYCLNRNLPGITEDTEYKVNVEKLVNDVKIWRAVTNGYPFKTAKQLGCNSDIEAFAATKMAVYDAMYNYDWSDFKGLNEQGNRVVKAAEAIATSARNSNDTKPSAVVSIKTDDEQWEMDTKDEKYASKTFYVETNVNSTEYSVNLSDVKIQNVKVTDEQNQDKKVFKQGEKFKVLIPISEMDKRGEFNIEVTADMKTMPILYGDSGSPYKQDYALAAGDYEYESAKLRIVYLENTTKLEIIKQDAETKEFLAGAKFNVLDEDKNIVYSDVTTGSDGRVSLENIMPGTYYIQEIKAPDGYTPYDKLIQVDIKLSQAVGVTVNNYTKPIQEEKQVEDGDITVIGEKEVNLPQTGF